MWGTPSAPASVTPPCWQLSGRLHLVSHADSCSPDPAQDPASLPLDHRRQLAGQCLQAMQSLATSLPAGYRASRLLARSDLGHALRTRVTKQVAKRTWQQLSRWAGAGCVQHSGHQRILAWAGVGELVVE